MRGKEFLLNIAEVDNDLIIESENALHQKKKTFHAKMWIVAAACICLCLCCTVPALAATGNEFAYEILYAIFPTVAQKLKPVNVSCEDNGIEMNVIAAEIDGGKTTILVSMQDITDSRLDETTDLFDSYSIRTPYNQNCGCSLVDYDAETKTATFMLTIEQMNHMLIPGDKITFSVSQLLSEKKHTDTQITQIDMNNLPLITDFVMNPNVNGLGGSDAEYVDRNSLQLMTPDEDTAVALEPGVTLTGYGIVEGKLHVQILFDDILNTDNHGYIYLKDRNGEAVICVSSISFWDDSNANSYQEYIFPVSAEELNNYEIWGEFWTCNSGPIEGNWQVTFPITEQ